MNKLSLLLPLTVALVACGAQEPASKTTAPAAVAATPADQPASPPPPQSAADLTDAKLHQVLAGAWRSDKNKARDQYRHPKQTLEFFGVKTGQSLIEITPGGGWYAEVLAPLLKGNGTYIAAVAQPKKPAGEDAQDKSALQKKFEGDVAEYGEAKTVEFDSKAPNLGTAGSADTVVTFRNVHNWVMSDTAPLMFKAFFDVLKPGGTLGVVDHRAAADADLAKIKQSGYLPQDYVIKLATDAGFKLVAQSEINANAKDTKDYEKGVWTLPPTLDLGDKDKDKYLAIGESDRMTLRFEKPKGDQIFQQEGDKAAGAAQKR
ncbi:MAG: methyltransferase [Dokdonella sp.]